MSRFVDPALVDDLTATALALAGDDRVLAVAMLQAAVKWAPLRVPGNAGENDNSHNPKPEEI